jgi:spore germination protein YaaH
MAASAGVQITRSLGGELWFDLLDSQVWFDDARSTLLTLTALSSALPSTVGVLYYGLGSEDPAVWSTVAGATQP